MADFGRLLLPPRRYNDADPWTAPGISPHMPPAKNLSYDLGGGGVSHCVYNAAGAQASIREWATPAAAAAATAMGMGMKHDDDDGRDGDSWDSRKYAQQY